VVSWCSWLSHHAHTVKVAGSNPAETSIFVVMDDGRLSRSLATLMAQLCLLLVLWWQ